MEIPQEEIGMFRKDILCQHEDCEKEATDMAILNGSKYLICKEHLRITDLGNWEGINQNV